MAARWRVFGWDVHEVDGHDIVGMANTLVNLNTAESLPHVLIARTVFGKGVSFMENQIKWHYWPMSDAECRQAMSEVEAIA
jgi:transketolase